MPMIIWFAIAMAILLVGGSTAMNVPEIGKDMAKTGTAVLVPIAYAVAVIMVIFAVAFGTKIAKGKDKNDHQK
jgi:hypothetical protein